MYELAGNAKEAGVQRSNRDHEREGGVEPRCPCKGGCAHG